MKQQVACKCTSSAKSVKKLTKDLKDIKKKFSMINMQLTKLQEVNLDVSRSEAEEEDSHFQTHAFQFTQLEKVFEPCITKLFKQSHGVKSMDLDLREIILLDSQSMMDLFCNQALIGKSFKANTSMCL